MIPDLLLHPDPAQLSSTANAADMLAALRALQPTDAWTERALQTVDQVLVTWTATAAARPDDVEGIAELQRLIDYARHRSANLETLPAASEHRWHALTDVLESRRLAIEGRDASRILRRNHVRTILAQIGSGTTQPNLAAALQQHGIDISAGRLSQLLGLLESHGLLQRRRDGRENRLTLTADGHAAVPVKSPPLRSKLAA